MAKRRSSTMPTDPVPARELRLQPSRSSTRLRSGFDMDSGTGSCSDSDSDSDSYSDPDTDLDALSDTDAEEDADDGSDDEELDDEELHTEVEEILEAITHYRNEGPAKPKQTDQTKKLWRREGEFWQEYGRKIQKRTGISPEEQLRACDPAVFKAYLLWRKKRSRIKKESTIDAYWNRTSMYYHDVVGHAMSNEVLQDIRNWIPCLGLDKSKKDKLAMYVQDLYAILHALWVDDTKPLHGFIRAQISLLLLLSAATATRPGALVESASNKGSNKALWFKDIELMKVRSLKDRSRSTLVANVNLENVKNKERDGTPKKFTFRLEGLPAFCIVSHILGISASQDAFRDNFTDIQQILDLEIPAGRNVLRIKWKEEVLNKPFFCDVTNGIGGGRVQRDKAFPYAKYRDIFVRLGRIAGFEAPLELYSLRRASGNNINSALDAVDRNQTMGHLGSTYEKYYTPTHIARDFQAIYFGTPSEEELIRSVASMGLSRDRRAPTELDDDQQEQVRNDPVLIALREKREKYKKMLKDKGFYPLAAGKGTRLYDKYEKKKRELASTYQQLHRIRLNEVIREFHDSIDTIEIARQLSGKPATEVLTLPMVEFELRSRATIASMLFKPFKDDRERLIFTRTLARLCQQQETRQPKALRRKNWEFVEHDSGAPLTKRHKAVTVRAEKRSYCHSSDLVRQELDSDDGDTGEIETHDLYPIVLPYPVCLICIGGQFPYERRMKHIPRKDVLKKHVEGHFRQPEYQNRFQCRHPQCTVMLDDIVHFKRHALDVHGVVH